MSENEKLVERDPDDHSREYIPLPGGWEVQTKGAGSSYRLLDTKTGERHLILSDRDWKPLQAFFTRFAHEVFAASRDEHKEAAAALTAAEARIKALSEALVAAVEPLEAMVLAGTDKAHSYEVQTAITSGVTVARQALSTLGGNADDR